MLEVLLRNVCEEIHMGAGAMISSIKRPGMQVNTDIIAVRRCRMCCTNNPKKERKLPEEEVRRGVISAE